MWEHSIQTLNSSNIFSILGHSQFAILSYKKCQVLLDMVSVHFLASAHLDKGTEFISDMGCTKRADTINPNYRVIMRVMVGRGDLELNMSSKLQGRVGTLHIPKLLNFGTNKI
jgi:hypothetical protein